MKRYSHRIALEFIEYILENSKEKLDAEEFAELLDDVKQIIDRFAH